MLKQIAFVAIAAATLVGAASSANAGRGGCDEWGCGSNGTQVRGIALGDLDGPPLVVAGIPLPPDVAPEPAPLVLAKKAKPKPRPNYDDFVRDKTVTGGEYWQIH